MMLVFIMVCDEKQVYGILQMFLTGFKGYLAKALNTND